MGREIGARTLTRESGWLLTCPQVPDLGPDLRGSPQGGCLRGHLIWLGRLSAVAGFVERLVPDELWELFQRVVPEAPVRPQGGGRRRHGDRGVLAAIIFVATSGCTWQQVPAASFGPSGATAHRRFTEWTKARVWAKLHRLILDELGARGELDWSRLDTFGQQPSAVNSQPGITVGHEDLRAVQS